MPELPEVEVIRRGLTPHVTGRRIVGAVFGNKRLRLPMPRAAIRRHTVGQLVTGVDRRAKYLLLTLDSGAVLVVHLGMTGRLGVFPADAPRARHDHLILHLDHGLDIRFNDSRRFGAVQFFEDPDAAHRQCFIDLGPEPLSGAFSAEYLHGRAAGRSAPVKSFLMDNRVVVGIGNIYASEILHAAGIRPRTPAGRLGRKRWQRLVAASWQILEQAIACGGTTISDFVNASGEGGYFQNELAVYGREGEACRRCGAPIRKGIDAGRATYWCNRCQR